MRVGPTYWDPPSCEGVLYSCGSGVVQESNPVGLTCMNPTNVSDYVNIMQRSFFL